MQQIRSKLLNFQIIFFEFLRCMEMREIFRVVEMHGPKIT